MDLLNEVTRLWTRSTIDTAYYYVKYMLPNRAAIKRTRALRNSRAGRSAFVFATGPSMRKLDATKIERLRREGSFDVFGVNSYVSTDFGRIASPDLYILSDPASWSRQIAEGEIAHLPEPERSAARERFYEETGSVWKMLKENQTLLFVPVDKLAQTTYPRAYAFCDAASVFVSNVVDVTRPLGYRSWTAYKALSIACYLGYERIYVCGIDNDAFKSITVDRQNTRRARYAHFYDDEATTQTFVSDGHISKDLFYTALSFGSLERFSGLPIVNLDPDGLVDAFSKEHALDVYSEAVAARAAE